MLALWSFQRIYIWLAIIIAHLILVCCKIYVFYMYTPPSLCPFSCVTVSGDRVTVSLMGNSLVRCELPLETWELLWELRNSVQAMMYRNLSNPSNAVINSVQDGKLISLLVELLNNTDSNPFVQSQHSDSEVD